MLLSYNDLVTLVNDRVITTTDDGVIDPSLINGASIDITLDDHIMVEQRASATQPINFVVDLKEKQTPNFNKIEIPDEGYQLLPNHFILAATSEKFFLPDDIVAEYVLKSSLARSGLQHMLAGYCDPRWVNSHLTLELKNETQYHTLLLRKQMKIGQVKFYRVKPVPHENSYAVHGQYNHSKGVTESGGLR